MESLKGDSEGLASGMGVGGRGLSAEPGEAHAVGERVVWGDPGVGILFLGA